MKNSGIWWDVSWNPMTAGVPFWWKGPGSKGVGPYSKDDTDNAIDMMCCHKLPSVQS